MINTAVAKNKAHRKSRTGYQVIIANTKGSASVRQLYMEIYSALVTALILFGKLKIMRHLTNVRDLFKSIPMQLILYGAYFDYNCRLLSQHHYFSMCFLNVSSWNNWPRKISLICFFDLQNLLFSFFLTYVKTC